MTRRSPTVRLVVACLAVVVAAGCGGTGPGPGPGSGPAGNAAPTCRTTLENCFGYEQMGQFLRIATDLVGRFFAAEYGNFPPPADTFYVEDGETGRSGCLDRQGAPARYSDASYEYCPANRSVYVGQNALWAMYSRLGDAAPVVALAHEWGHHLQTVIGVPPPRTLAQSVNFENQADCVAGGWTKYASDQGLLEYPDDLQDIGGLLEAIASREGPDRDHGTVEERTQSFLLGFRNGLPGCNRFSPATPLVG